ncbi:FkbM family methyltransferase [Jannaschia sp.]|nr:FkbM family methyltransferase [Jannaschia sp.]
MEEYEHILRNMLKADKPWSKHEIRTALPTVIKKWGGVKFLVDPTYNRTEYILWLRSKPPEHSGTSYLAETFAGQTITMVDAGANVGIFSLPIAKAASPDSRFLLIEPNPAALGRLRANIALNRLTNVEVVETALGATDGEARLYFSKNGNLGEARIGLPFDQDYGGIDVPIRALPGLLAARGMDRVDLLKVDVEGLEDKVILPLLTAEPKIDLQKVYFEDAHAEDWDEDVGAALLAAGFEAGPRFGENALYLRV